MTLQTAISLLISGSILNASVMLFIHWAVHGDFTLSIYFRFFVQSLIAIGITIMIYNIIF